MPLKPSPLLGGAYQSRSRLLNAQRCINLYGELVETKDGKEVGALYGTPGYFTVRSGDDGPWRALHAMGNGALFGVINNRFVQISNRFGLTDLGILATDRSPVGICDNGTQLLITDRTNAYGYDIPSNHFAFVTLPFTSGFPSTCAYQDGVFLLAQGDTQTVWQSAILDVFNWSGLAKSEKDGQPDPVSTIVSSRRQLWVFGTQTTEVWVDDPASAGTDFFFIRLPGVFTESGCVAPATAIELGENVAWLGSSVDGQGMVMMSSGLNAQRISTHAIEREIQSYANIADAFAQSYQIQGHLFYVLTFPTGDATWSFDVSTGLWHELASFDNGDFHRHRQNCAATLKGNTIIGDFENGNLYQLDLNTQTDAGKKKKWLRSWPAQGPGQISLRNDRYVQLQVYMETGNDNDTPIPIRVLASSDQNERVIQPTPYNRALSGVYDEVTQNYRDPQVMLRWSDTGGKSFGNEHWRSVGKIGEVRHRVRWAPCGSSRDRVWELSATDPFFPALIAGLQEVEQGIS